MRSSIFSLPAVLISLILVSPVFAVSTSSNDPFHAISTHVVRKEDPPICCLRPLEPFEPVEEGVLLTFEEWKQKQRDKQNQGGSNGNSNVSSLGGSGGGTLQRQAPPHNNGGSNRDRGLNPQNNESSSSSSSNDSTTPDSMTQVTVHEEKVSPHFQVPLTDRFNYASMDCSARVHASHRSAKSPSSILSSKRDRYMLSPCVNPNPKEDQFVVVELCEDIRIDTVQLANFEFFSGVFKEFTVSVAKTYIGGTSKEGWVTAGTYKAKNIRGVQSFHPGPSLRDFYRFIRIDFHSHYSSEFYCPVSLLRVYGLTHLEEWKWEIWEAESRGREKKIDTAENGGSTEVIPEDPQRAHTVPVSPESSPGLVSMSPTGASAERLPGQQEDSAIFTTSVTTGTSSPASSSNAQSGSMPVTYEPSESSPSASTSNGSGTTSLSTHHSDNTGSSSGSSPRESLSQASGGTVKDGNTNETSLSTPLGTGSGSASSPSVQGVTTTTTIYASPTGSSSLNSNSVATRAMPLATGGGGGESIYRTIMNRLSAIEGNHTLYAQYFEEQTCGVREMLRRIGEDVGRLEGIEKAQSKMFLRNVQEFEKQRRKLEMEYSELVSKVGYLSDEIVLEKRLGIAQLCLLLTVLIFMTLTRGSRGESPVMDMSIRRPRSFSKSAREWGRRHLSLSFGSDWDLVSRIRGSRSGSESSERNVGVVSGVLEPPSLPSNPIEGSASPPSKSPPSKSPPSKSPRSITPHPVEPPSSSSSPTPPNQFEFPLLTLPKTAPLKVLNTPTKALSSTSHPDQHQQDSDHHRRRHHHYHHHHYYPRTAAIMQRQRSRTPSLRTLKNTNNTNGTKPPSTPTTSFLNHNPGTPISPNKYIYNANATPATSSLAIGTPSTSRPRLKRANSHGSSTSLAVLGPSLSWAGGVGNGGGGVIIGPVPKSAKRWARSAHLHEVKVVRHKQREKEVSPTKGGGERETMREKKEKEKENLDVGVDVDVDVEAHAEVGNGKRGDEGGGPMSVVSSVLSPSASPNGHGLRHVRALDLDGEADADNWEDTETDASVDVDVDAGFGFGYDA
ncbi:hypothetical protein L218DRAFT_911830 [Marasmius fiardii PR-910]|nr:hypothetical protein L218DRAFT_911830 [Marasmius fiardii PR-910]